MRGIIDTNTGASSISTPTSSVGEHTPGPWVFRVYANDEAYIATLRAVGLEPVRLLSNDGQATVMTAGDDPKPVARVECQTKFKRGQGYRTNCSERDANAHLIASAPDMLASHVENARILRLLVNELQGRVEGGKLAALAQCLDRSDAAVAKATGADR